MHDHYSRTGLLDHVREQPAAIGDIERCETCAGEIDAEPRANGVAARSAATRALCRLGRTPRLRNPPRHVEQARSVSPVGPACDRPRTAGSRAPVSRPRAIARRHGSTQCSRLGSDGSNHGGCACARPSAVMSSPVNLEVDRAARAVPGFVAADVAARRRTDAVPRGNDRRRRRLQPVCRRAGARADRCDAASQQPTIGPLVQSKSRQVQRASPFP